MGGDRKVLLKRHREFVLHHNAQIDAFMNGEAVRSDRQIARDINTEEKKLVVNNFFQINKPNTKRSHLRRKEKSAEAFKKLIEQLNLRMGEEWCKRRRRFRRKRRIMKRRGQSGTVNV